MHSRLSLSPQWLAFAPQYTNEIALPLSFSLTLSHTLSPSFSFAAHYWHCFVVSYPSLPLPHSPTVSLSLFFYPSPSSLIISVPLTLSFSLSLSLSLSLFHFFCPSPPLSFILPLSLTLSLVDYLYLNVAANAISRNCLPVFFSFRKEEFSDIQVKKDKSFFSQKKMRLWSIRFQDDFCRHLICCWEDIKSAH